MPPSPATGLGGCFNMNCPYCSSTNTIGNGKTKAGSPRYRCKDCGKSWSEGKTGRPRRNVGACPHCGSSDTKNHGAGRLFCYSCGKTANHISNTA